MGAGGIGYFAYHAGFINDLFGNAATAARVGIVNITQQGHTMAGLPSSSTALAAGRLDEDGILMMATPKLGGYSYRFNPILIHLRYTVRCKRHRGFEIKQENGVKFIKFMLYYTC